MEKGIDIQSRKWQLTINNPLEKDYTHDKIKKILHSFKPLIYYCISDEIAKIHHTHIYILFKSPVRFSTLQNRFNKQAHIEKAYGTSNQNRDYVFKEGKWIDDKKRETNLADSHVEWGEIPQERQGARNDLTELYELINEGMSNYEILEYKPEFINQLERMERVRQTIQEESFKDIFRHLEVTYLQGDTGSGKTRSIMDTYGYANVYRVTNYKNPFDQYKGQDVIAFEEFHSSLPINQMLLYLDGYPVTLPCRYYDKTAMFTKVFILSNIDLTKQYQEIQEYSPETWNAFLRRINRVKVFTKDGITEYQSVQEYYEQLHGFQPVKESPFDTDNK